MAKDPLALATVIALRTGAVQGTPITASDTDVLASDLVDARIEACKSGILIATIEAMTTVDEVYGISLIGRQGATGSYTTLATITPTAIGVYAAAVPGPIKDSLNYAVVATGSTPSFAFGLVFIATEVQYLPDVGTIVTA